MQLKPRDEVSPELTKYFLLVLIKGILFAGIITYLFFSCNKKDDDLPEDLKTGIYLEIDPEYNSYVSEGGKHYYSNAFGRKNDTAVYRISVERGTKYQLYCVFSLS